MAGTDVLGGGALIDGGAAERGRRAGIVDVEEPDAEAGALLAAAPRAKISNAVEADGRGVEPRGAWIDAANDAERISQGWRRAAEVTPEEQRAKEPR